MRLKDKVAIITGGASGIGRATALRFSHEGALVSILDRDCIRGNALRSEIAKLGGKGTFLETDIAVEDQVCQAVRKTEAEFGAVHILVNNAAAFVFGSYDVAWEEWQKVLSVNIVGTAACSRYAAEAMIRAGGGAIVNVTSISGFIAQERSLPYNTSKSALLGLNRCLAMELARHNIRVNAVAPGWIDTPQLRADIELSGLTYEQSHKQDGPLHLLNRFGTADEVANAILFLASEDASFITGTCLMVDGGYTAK